MKIKKQDKIQKEKAIAFAKYFIANFGYLKVGYGRLLYKTQVIPASNPPYKKV